MAQRSVYQIDARLVAPHFRVAAERNSLTCRKHFAAKPRKSSRAEKQILAQEQRILDQRSAAHKIRIHGDYHLGQALYTGKDFIILDFEGEPARPLSERKLKRSALRDVAGMMRSFQYAAYSALWQPAMRPEDIPFLETLGRSLVSADEQHLFAELSRGHGRRAFSFRATKPICRLLLEAYLLDKAVYEIGYELNHRPDWVVIPIRGIKHILKSA